MEFKLTIEMGNDAMQTADDVADALRTVADKLNSGRDGGFILDTNGNVVGQYDILEP